MRDIYKTAKEAQMAPVRGRVKAMMAQPRAIPQARKIARQTTGFARGGMPQKKKPKWVPDIRTTGPTFPGPPKEIEKVLNGRPHKKQKGGTMTPMTHDSELTKWFLEKHGGTKKGKPHSTREGRIAAGERALWRGVEEQEKKKKRRMGRPGAPSRSAPKKKPEEGMYVQKGGVVDQEKRKKAQEKFTESSIDKKNRWRRRQHPAPVQYQKGGVMEKRKVYELANKLKNKDRLTEQDIKRAEELTKKFGGPHGTALKNIERFLKTLKKEPSLVGKKKGGKVDKKWIQKAVNPKHKGYCTPMTKPTCTPARKKLAQLFKRKARTGWKKAQGGLIKGKPKLATRGW